MFKNIVKESLLKLGYFTDASQDRKEIEQFLESVKPVKTQYDLVRIGNHKGDGGYLLPDDFQGVTFCFSPGVSNETSFDEAMSSRGIKCFLADYSVDESPLENMNTNFLKKFIGSYDNQSNIEVNRWIRNELSDLGGDGILQMDIEGHEYEIIYALDTELLKRFRMVIIEFHGLDYLFSTFGFQIIHHSFQKLLKYFEVVHIHPNNCCGMISKGDIKIPRVMEFTFFRKDRVEYTSEKQNFPHELDVKNSPYDDITLPECWYK